MKNKILILIILALIIVSGSIVISPELKKRYLPSVYHEAEEEDVEYKRISQEEAKKIMDCEKDIIILDVRTKSEYDSGHIRNAVNIPNEEITVKENIEKLPDKNAKILVYCRSGARSRESSQKLSYMGYNNVYEFGGINTWQYGIVK